MMTSSAAICATRRARNPVVLVNSGSIDFTAPVPSGSIVEANAQIDFHSPVAVGELVDLQAAVAETRQTSLVIDVEATAEDPCTRAIHPCTRAQFVLAPARQARDRPEPARPFGRIPVTVD